MLVDGKAVPPACADLSNVVVEVLHRNRVRHVLCRPDSELPVVIDAPRENLAIPADGWTAGAVEVASMEGDRSDS